MKTPFAFALCLFCLLSFNSYPAKVGVSDAQRVALSFFTLNNSGAIRQTPSAHLVYTGLASDSMITFYIFDMSPAKGFVIVSASENDDPVIGYSTESHFVSGFSGIGLSGWLQRWTEEIHYAEKNNVVVSARAKSLWDAYRAGIEPGGLKSSAVGPLCTTSWDQEDESGILTLYNNYCPNGAVPTTHALTGCVATAMAQILKYWNYPQYGRGIATYDDDYADGFWSNYGVQTFNFDATPFNWAAMPDSLSVSTSGVQDSAVALLMYACGVSVDMDYGPSESGAWVISSESPNGACAQQAYSTYFNYQSNTIQAIGYANYTNDAWIQILENEFNAGRPVQYQGTSDEGGHSWVCDGYNTSDMMHMNWGWGGQDNGWYAINNLDPEGFDPFTTFTYDIYALIGIKPGASILCGSSAICKGSSTTLSVANVPPAATYSWKPAAGLSCTNCASPFASPSSTTTYSVTVDSGSYTSTSSVTIHVNTPGAIDYNISGTSICQGSSVTLNLYGATGININPSVGVKWLDSADAVLTPSSTTNYSVSSVSSVCADAERANINIDVTQHAPVSFNLSDSSICPGTIATLGWQGLSNVAVEQGYDYFFDGSVLKLNPLNTEFYTVSGSSGCGSIYTDVFTITILSDAWPNFSLPKAALCLGDTAVLSVQGADSVQILTFHQDSTKWITPFGNDTFLLTPDTTSEFILNVYRYACGDTLQYANYITEVVTRPGVFNCYTPDTGIICGKKDAVIYVKGINPGIQSFPFLDFIFTDSNDAYAYPLIDPSISYTISAQTVCGTQGTATFNFAYAPAFSYQLQPATICAGDTTLLTLSGISNAQITTPATGFLMIDSSHYQLFPDSTLYFRVEGNTCQGHGSYFYIQPQVFDPDSPNYAIGPTNICAGEGTSIQFTGILTAQVNPPGVWDTIDSSYVSLNPTITTIYTISGENVCGANFSKTFTVQVGADPEVNLEPADICPGSYATLTLSNITGAIVTSWDTTRVPNSSVKWINDSTAELSPDTTWYYYVYGNTCGGFSYYDERDLDDVAVYVLPGSGFNCILGDSVLCTEREDEIYIQGASGVSITPYAPVVYLDSFDAYAYVHPQDEHNTYVVSATSLCSRQQYSDTFNINIEPAGTYLLSDSVICLGDTVRVGMANWDGVAVSPMYNVIDSIISEYELFSAEPATLYLFPQKTTTYTISGTSKCLGYINNSDTFNVTIKVITPPPVIDSPLITISNTVLSAPPAYSYQWLRNGVYLPGDTAEYFMAPGDGNYDVIINAGTSCRQTLPSVAITNIDSSSGTFIYPNPTNANWFISVSNLYKGGQFEIYDIEGRKVLAAQIENTPFEVSNNFAAGVYTLVIFSGQSKWTSKLVKL